MFYHLLQKGTKNFTLLSSRQQFCFSQMLLQKFLLTCKWELWPLTCLSRNCCLYKPVKVAIETCSCISFLVAMWEGFSVGFRWQRSSVEKLSGVVRVQRSQCRPLGVEPRPPAQSLSTRKQTITHIGRESLKWKPQIQKILKSETF